MEVSATPAAARYNAWMTAGAAVQAQIFSGHESFPVRLTWLTKAVRQCEPEAGRDLFSRPDAMERLGVGKNMVRSMRWWAIVAGMLEVDGEGGRVKRLRPTRIASLLFGSDGLDPFMEDPGTVWLLHWALATNGKLATWHLAFNGLRETEFDRSHLVRHLQAASAEGGGRAIAEDTVERDVDCFLRTYVQSGPDKPISREEVLDCPLTELRLIRRTGTPNGFSFVRGGHNSLPEPLFAYCLMEYLRGRRQQQSKATRFEEVAYGVGSPGQIFKLTENALVDRLHRVGELTGQALRYDDTSGLRQIFNDCELDPTELLVKYYASKDRGGHHAVAR